MSDDSPRQGFCKNGRPHKPGNTDADGQYIHGKGRPPVSTRFAAGDGRKRGSRARGTKNFVTDLRETLAEKVEKEINGKRRKLTKQKLLINNLVARAATTSDRAAEIVLRHSGEDRQTAKGPSRSDAETLRLYLEQRASMPTGDPESDEDNDDGV